MLQFKCVSIWLEELFFVVELEWEMEWMKQGCTCILFYFNGRCAFKICLSFTNSHANSDGAAIGDTGLAIRSSLGFSILLRITSTCGKCRHSDPATDGRPALSIILTGVFSECFWCQIDEKNDSWSNPDRAIRETELIIKYSSFSVVTSSQLKRHDSVNSWETSGGFEPKCETSLKPSSISGFQRPQCEQNRKPQDQVSEVCLMRKQRLVVWLWTDRVKWSTNAPTSSPTRSWLVHSSPRCRHSRTSSWEVVCSATIWSTPLVTLSPVNCGEKQTPQSQTPTRHQLWLSVRPQ